MPRLIQCPVTETECGDPNCSINRCRQRERDQQVEIDRRAATARVQWEREAAERQEVTDRRKAALRAIKEFIAEKNVEREAAGERLLEMPFGKGSRKTLDDLITRILAAPAQVERIQRHLDMIVAERKGWWRRPSNTIRVRRPKPPLTIEF